MTQIPTRGGAEKEETPAPSPDRETMQLEALAEENGEMDNKELEDGGRKEEED